MSADPDLADAEGPGDPSGAVTSTAPGGYRSPLMARLAGPGRLTLDLLHRDVPVFQAGRAAEQRLRGEEPLAEPERARLLAAAAAGEQAKERLVLAALPLVRHLAHREHLRRRAWQSPATVEDLCQEGVIGLLQGLARYDPGGPQSSPTNYLGQWVLTLMRRGVEAIDNDFGVGYEAAERFRRIRALRARLHGQLGRTPTDQEMIDAWGDPVFTGGHKLGRVRRAAPPRRGPGLTAAQLADEQRLRHRVGLTGRLTPTDPAAPRGDPVDRARPLDEASGGDVDDVVEAAARAGLARLLHRTVRELGLPPVQQEVVARRFGLPPHPGEQPLREIGAAVGIRPERVTRIVEAFMAEMSRPGGVFHRVCAELTPAELADLGLGWVPGTLGEWERVPAAAKAAPAADILRAPLRSARAHPPPPPSPAGAPPPAGHVRAQFVCDYHDWGFVGVYRDRGQVPARRSCPRCARPSPLVRVLPD